MVIFLSSECIFNLICRQILKSYNIYNIYIITNYEALVLELELKLIALKSLI